MWIVEGLTRRRDRDLASRSGLGHQQPAAAAARLASSPLLASSYVALLSALRIFGIAYC